MLSHSSRRLTSQWGKRQAVAVPLLGAAAAKRASRWPCQVKQGRPSYYSPPWSCPSWIGRPWQKSIFPPPGLRRPFLSPFTSAGFDPVISTKSVTSKSSASSQKKERGLHCQLSHRRCRRRRLRPWSRFNLEKAPVLHRMVHVGCPRCPVSVAVSSEFYRRGCCNRTLSQQPSVSYSPFLAFSLLVAIRDSPFACPSIKLYALSSSLSGPNYSAGFVPSRLETTAIPVWL